MQFRSSPPRPTDLYAATRWRPRWYVALVAAGAALLATLCLWPAAGASYVVQAVLEYDSPASDIATAPPAAAVAVAVARELESIRGRAVLPPTLDAPLQITVLDAAAVGRVPLLVSTTIADDPQPALADLNAWTAELARRGADEARGDEARGVDSVRVVSSAYATALPAPAAGWGGVLLGLGLAAIVGAGAWRLAPVAAPLVRCWSRAQIEAELALPVVAELPGPEVVLPRPTAAARAGRRLLAVAETVLAATVFGLLFFALVDSPWIGRLAASPLAAIRDTLWRLAGAFLLGGA